MIYLDLFLGFLKVGCFSFGGAYGAIPLIRDVVLEYGWLNDDSLSYMIAVSESTPGPIMVNVATFVGANQAGMPGAVISTLAVIIPAFVIVILITALLQKILKNKYVQAVLKGVKPCVTGIVLATGVYMLISNCIEQNNIAGINLRAIIIAVILGGIMNVYHRIKKKKISPIMLIIIAAVAGIVFYGL